MGFEIFGGAVDCGAGADVGDATMCEGLPCPACADGVDAEFGAKVFAERDVGGWDVDGAAALRAFKDYAEDCPFVAEHFGGVCDFALLQELADAGGGEGVGVAVAERREFRYSDFMRGEPRFELFHVAAAFVAEDEIVARDDMLRTETLEQNFFDEILRRELREFGREGADEDFVDAGGFEQAFFYGEWSKAEGRRIGLENCARVRFERQDTRGYIHRARFFDRGFGDEAMPTVDAVEITERENTAFFRYFFINHFSCSVVFCVGL